MGIRGKANDIQPIHPLLSSVRPVWGGERPILTQCNAYCTVTI